MFKSIVRKRRNQPCEHGYETLEPRQLLATVTGRPGPDSVRLIHAGENLVDVIHNGERLSDVDVSNGLTVDLGGGMNWVTIDPAITENLVVRNAAKITMTGGQNHWMIGDIPLDAPADDTVIRLSSLGGKINENIRFSNATQFVGGDGKDQFTVNSNGFTSAKIYGGGGDDIFQLAVSTVFFRGDGSDPDPSSLSFTASSFEVYGEQGNDRFRVSGFNSVNIDGGDGFDLVDMRDRDFVSVEVDPNNQQLPHDFGFISGVPRNVWVERFVGSPDSENIVRFRRDAVGNSFDWVINGRMATLTDVDTGNKIEFVDFNAFEAAGNGFDRFYVMETARDIRVVNADWIQFSSKRDAAEGNLDGIAHEVFVAQYQYAFEGEVPGDAFVAPGNYDLDGVLDPTVIISNRGGAGSGIFNFGIDDIQIDSDGRIVFDQTRVVERISQAGLRSAREAVFQPQLIVHGSDQADDYFVVQHAWAKLAIFGHGGNDQFMIGSSNANANGNLDTIQKLVTTIGGQGHDRLTVNDQAFNRGNGAYSVTNRFITEGLAGGDEEDRRDFAAIQFNESMEVIRLAGGHGHRNVYHVWPNPRSRIVIDGNNDSGALDRLNVYGRTDVAELHRTSDVDGGWTFEGLARPVVYYGVESTGSVELPGDDPQLFRAIDDHFSSLGGSSSNA